MPAYCCRTLVLVLSLIHWATAAALTNQLQDHPSPYLALHGSDPVAWQDWTSDAVDLARQQDKLLYISVGYFSCHWCHVMQKESYKDEEIAGLLNENFIPVKVDRELEPALDARLIEFAQATQGRAGWPLNVFLTPQGHPLYAVLYMPPNNFHQVLTRLNDLWRDDRQNLTKMAARETKPTARPADSTLDRDAVRELGTAALSHAMGIADTLQGGFGQSNKFPMAPQIGFLLQAYGNSHDAELREFLMLTLDHMADNGMYDHVGDGFFRYSTDPGWETPHFEKMLYDNAQLAVLYLRAEKLFGIPRYGDIARRTLEFMSREMADDTGAMFASFSAVDDKGVEGGYYLWRKAELSQLLTDTEREVMELAWSMRGPLKFAAGYLPRKGLPLKDISANLQIAEPEVVSAIESARNKLYQARSARALPVDTKLLAGWNGLALAAYAEAAIITKNDEYLDSARRIRDYIMSELWDGSALRRAVDGDRVLGKASLEDYAFVSRGLWMWARLSQEPVDFAIVQDVVEQAWARFYADGWRMAESSFIAVEPRRDLIADGPMPSPAAVVAQVSLDVAEKSANEPLRRRALAALNSGGRQLDGKWFWHVSHIRALLAANGAESTVAHSP
jgi:uncharacterized protein YyaL (SSP411 family)